MTLLPHRAVVAVFASVATGVVVTLASGELRADRDIEHELLRANESLVERLAAQEHELAELRGTVLAMAAKPNETARSTRTQPNEQPTTKVQAELEEKLAFRKKVLEAMKPELEAIATKAAAAKTTFDKHVEAYAKHRHEYEVTAHGWVRLDGLLTTEGKEMLRPTYSDDWFATIRTDGGQLPSSIFLEKQTGKPK